MILAKKSIAVELADLAHQQTRDGNFVLQNGLGRPFVGSHDLAQIDRRGSDDADMPAVAATSLGTTTVFARKHTGSPDRPGYWNVPGRSTISEMMAVVSVPWKIPAVPILRPPAMGMGPIAALLRSNPIPESSIDVSRLPSRINLSKITVPVPTIAQMTHLFSDFSGDGYSGWATDTRTPDWQHPGYGTYLNCCVSQALVLLSSTLTAEEKRPLAIALAQWGLDLAAAFGDGRVNNYAGGGHMLGRKALVILLGHLLGIETIANPTDVIGLAFAEDAVYEQGSWWFGGGWNATWRHSQDWEYIKAPPATWNDSMHLRFGYMQQVVGSAIGTVLAMKMIGRRRALGASMVRMIEQWMGPIQHDADQQLRDVGLPQPWGKDYAVGQGLGLCEQAWRQIEGG